MFQGARNLFAMCPVLLELVEMVTTEHTTVVIVLLLNAGDYQSGAATASRRHQWRNDASEQML